MTTGTTGERSVDALLMEHAEIEEQLADPAIHADAGRARKLGRRYAELGQVVAAARALAAAREDLVAARELAAEDSGFAGEADELAARIPALETKLAELMRPRDPHDGDDLVMEVKSGEGGEESALFAGDLVRMYTRYAEARGWKVEVLDAITSDLGGVKDTTLVIRSRDDDPEGVWARLKFEGGVHRVQRVPVTESQGRIHTSAAGVLVYPDTGEESPLEIDENEIRVDVFRASGHGGQGVNTTDSAVRITHLPTGIVVSCQNERSQIQNRASAMAVLQAKLLERRREEEQSAMNALKDGGNSWGNQMRSYVLHPYQMVKDLRTEYEVGNPTAVFDGDLDGFLEAGIRWRRTQERAQA